MNIAEVVVERDRLERKRAIEAKEHAEWVKRNDAQLAECNRLLDAHAAGADVDRIVKAQQIIYITARTQGLGRDRRSVIADAIRSIAMDGAAPDGVYRGLREGYYGTKNYDRWTDQREDHSYWAGPAHGTTVFSVGFRREYLSVGLTNEQIDACIYYLEAFRDGRVTGSSER